jgi:hypothetical protein
MSLKAEYQLMALYHGAGNMAAWRIAGIAALSRSLSAVISAALA